MTADFAKRTAAGRESLATNTFVQLADTLVVDFDVTGVLTLLAGSQRRTCRRLGRGDSHGG